MGHFAILLIFVGCLTLGANGLKCFSCTLSVGEGETDPDLTCVNTPDQVPGKNIITCPARMKYCTIVRNDLKTGAISSFERNCAENPPILNDDIEGGDMITHFRSCLTDLCNKGTGLESSDSGSGGSGGATIIPGKNSANRSATLSLLITTVAMYILFCLN